MSTPQTKAKPVIKLTFDLGGLVGKDFGYLFKTFEFKGMVNGGYIVRATLVDAHFNLLDQLVEEGYFKETRLKPVTITFQILSGDEGVYPASATRPQTAILLSLDAGGSPADKGNIEFVAIDPPSWFLNMGDASGKVYKGRVDQVINQVIREYAPGISAEVGRTTDSAENKWPMLRQDPKTFISSFLDWSSSITLRKTQWLIEMDGNNLMIKEQGALTSRQRAYYRFLDQNNHDTIKNWKFLADNALSIVQTKLVTAGLSAISGQYLDPSLDIAERDVFVKDSSTTNKQIARITDDQGFTKAPDADPPRAGWTHVTATPELFSAGDIGLTYNEYIDGRARGMWLNMVNALMRVKFECLGHGEWSDCRGLGVDTVYVRWTQGRRADGTGDRYWWMTGNWLVYGFHHRVKRGEWITDLYCARYDHDSESRKVGS